jgi:hypothetical protein
MTREQYIKIKAVAEDERADPHTRAVAQKQVEKWKTKMEGPPKSVHPGLHQTEEYRAWVKNLNVGSKREPGPR